MKGFKDRNQRLVRLRTRLGLTQVEMSAMLGKTRCYISHVEMMLIYPSAPIQRKICDFFRSHGVRVRESSLFPIKCKRVSQLLYSLDHDSGLSASKLKIVGLRQAKKELNAMDTQQSCLSW